MKKILILTTIIVIHLNSFSQRTELVKEWVMMDTLFISQVSDAYKISTSELFKTLEVNNNRIKDLGFGYILKSGSNGKGYMSFDYKILSYKNEVVAYELSSTIPNRKKKIRKLYKEKLSEIFEIDDKDKVKPIEFGFENATSSMDELKVQLDTTLNKIMNPFIGIVFGNRCGYGMSVLKNREIFDEIINPINCEYLLFSKNPATRIMAIEYFYCHLSDFNSVQKSEIETRIEEIKKYSTRISTCGGCIVGQEKTTELISRIKNCK
ncbi:hypothetical protein [Aureibaculum luteum]|uniref:hypothetical protein n=1 Tax=Aureibaculum luteum TaxID=1548456 RepID=UPI001E2AA90C|nr:hypothetical protein [Aureibaculum luteum]